GTFSEQARAWGIADVGLSTHAAFFDYDRDGDLDLYVVNYVRWSPEGELRCFGPHGEPDYCSPEPYKAPASDVLYRNEGDGTFTDVSEAAGIRQASGNGLGVVCADFNGDGRPDVVAANDLQANQLWINRGDGTFSEQALERAVAFNAEGMAESGMGIDARDVDDDGDWDLFMSHFEGQTNTLYLNDGGFFVDVSDRWGMEASRPSTGFGTALLDFDHDGIRDLYVANGRVSLPKNPVRKGDPYVEANQLFAGIPGGGFREITPRGGTRRAWHHSSRGAAFGDFDNDGDLDIFVNNRDGPAYVLENVAVKRGHWIGFRVRERDGTDAIGARVEIRFKGRRRFDEVRRAYSYCSSNDPRVHFGLGAVRRIDRVVVRWIDGTEETFGPFDADRYRTIRRGR
ncbi:MAG: CRTAC1 family protein, partial [Planctomycetota bacterium]